MNGLACLGLVLLAAVVQGQVVDIRQEVSDIVKYHNNERRDEHLVASDMLEMKWDDQLARLAGRYSEKCLYRRPRSHEFDVGSNLYIERDFVHSEMSVKRMINSSLEAWARPKRWYSYGPHCGHACSYVQMITSQTHGVGCALHTCSTLYIDVRIERSFTLFVCFYSPRTHLTASLPYRRHSPCSQCPAGTFCNRGLCSQKDKLTVNEIQQLTSAHNRIRRANNRAPLKWDADLEKWAHFVIRCTSNYPGPVHSYTNFARLEKEEDLYQKICSWPSEGLVANIQLIHDCRTPYDQARCNHYTNVLQPRLTSMACAAEVCSDDTRQLVCIYDNKVLRLRDSWE